MIGSQAVNTRARSMEIGLSRLNRKLDGKRAGSLKQLSKQTSELGAGLARWIEEAVVECACRAEGCKQQWNGATRWTRPSILKRVERVTSCGAAPLTSAAPRFDLSPSILFF